MLQDFFNNLCNRVDSEQAAVTLGNTDGEIGGLTISDLICVCVYRRGALEVARRLLPARDFARASASSRGRVIVWVSVPADFSSNPTAVERMLL